MNEAAETTLPGVVECVSLRASTMGAVGHGRDHVAREVATQPASSPLVQVDEGGLGAAPDAYALWSRSSGACISAMSMRKLPIG